MEESRRQKGEIINDKLQTSQQPQMCRTDITHPVKSVTSVSALHGEENDYRLTSYFLAHCEH